MIITLQQIKENGPCSDGWKLLLKSIPGYTMSTTVSIEYILGTNGVKGAYWALRCLPYENYCGLLADVADSVSYLTDDDRVHNCISVIRAYSKGEAIRRHLTAARAAAGDAAREVDGPAWFAACAAAWAAWFADREAAGAAAWLAAGAAAGADAGADAKYTPRVAVRGDPLEEVRRKQWKTNEELMRSWISRQKHVDTRVGARK